MRRVGTAVRNVLGDRGVEDERLLEDDGDLVAQRAQCQVANVDAVDRHRPVRGVIEAKQQLRERRLAGTAAADHGDDIAGADLERDGAENVAVRFGVPETDVMERDTPGGALDVSCVGALGDRRPLVKELDDPLGARECGRECVAEPPEAADR